MLSWVAWWWLVVEPAIPPPPDPLELELRWQAPPGCPTAADIEARVRALLPGEGSGEDVLHVEASVSVTENGASAVIVSTFRDDREERVLEARRCADLGESIALLVAIALEPGRASTLLPLERAPSPVPLPEPAPPVAVVTPALVFRAPPLRPRRSLVPRGFRVRVAAGVDAGTVPPPTVVLQIAPTIVWPRLRLELPVAWLAPRTRLDSLGRGASFQMATLGLRACARPFVRAVEFPVCAGPEAGLVFATTRGISPSGSSINPWFAALASAGVARAWGRFAVWSSLEGVARIVGTQYFVGQERLWRPFPVSARMLIGIELRGPWTRGGGGQ